MQVELSKTELQMIAEMLSQAAVKIDRARIAADLNDKITAALATLPAHEKG